MSGYTSGCVRCRTWPRCRTRSGNARRLSTHPQIKTRIFRQVYTHARVRTHIPTLTHINMSWEPSLWIDDVKGASEMKGSPLFEHYVPRWGSVKDQCKGNAPPVVSKCEWAKEKAIIILVYQHRRIMNRWQHCSIAHFWLDDWGTPSSSTESVSGYMSLVNIS